MDYYYSKTSLTFNFNNTFIVTYLTLNEFFKCTYIVIDFKHELNFDN